MASFNNITSYDEKLLDELEGYNQDDFNRNQIVKEFLSSDLYNNIKEGDLLIGFEKPRNIEPPINLSDPNFDPSLLYSRRSDPNNILSRPIRGLIEQYGISDFDGTYADLREKLQNLINEKYYNSTKKRPSVFIVLEVKEVGPVNYFGELRQQNKIENINHYSEPNTIEYVSLSGDPTKWRDKSLYLLEIPIYFDEGSKSYKFHSNSLDYSKSTRSIYDLFLQKYKRHKGIGTNNETSETPEEEKWINIKIDIEHESPFFSTQPILKRINESNPNILNKISKFGNRNILSAIRNREIGRRGGFKKTKKNKKNKTKRKNNKGGTKRKKKTRSIVNKISDEKRRKKWVPMLNELVKKLREKEKIEKNERIDELLTPTGNSIIPPDKSILTEAYNEKPYPPIGTSFNPYNRSPLQIPPPPTIEDSDDNVESIDDEFVLSDVSPPNKKLAYIPPIINPDNINTPIRIPPPQGTPISAENTPNEIRRMRRDTTRPTVSSDFSPTPTKESNLTIERKKK